MLAAAYRGVPTRAGGLVGAFLLATRPRSHRGTDRHIKCHGFHANLTHGVNGGGEECNEFNALRQLRDAIFRRPSQKTSYLSEIPAGLAMFHPGLRLRMIICAHTIRVRGG